MTPTLQASDLDVEGLVRELDGLVSQLSWGPSLADARLVQKAASALQSRSAQLAAEKARADKLRRALIEAGTAAGGYLSDEVSDDFLTRVPYEVKACVAAAEANLLTATKALEPISWKGIEIPIECPLPRYGEIGAPDAYDIDPGAGSAMNRLSREWPLTPQVMDLRIRTGEITPLYARTALSHEAHNG